MNSGTHIPRFPEDLEDFLHENDPSNIKELKQTWSILKAVETAENYTDVDQALNRLRDALNDQEQKKPHRMAEDRQPQKLRRSPFRARSGAFLSAAVMALIVFLYWPITVEAPLGQRSAVVLPDGSNVELNSGSTIRYARLFRAMPFASKIHLTGEAYFDVTTKNRVFEVQTTNSSIQVLGTSFNVRSWDNTMKTTVVVEEGRVQVRDLTSETELILAADEMTQATGKPLEKHVSSGLSLAWRQGGLYLADETLSGVVNELSRRFDKRIVVDATASISGLENMHYSNATDVESIIQDLCVKHELKYRPIAGGFELFR